MIISIDFDGVIAISDYPEIKGVMNGAVAAIQELSKKHYIIINTCRSGEHLLEAINWMLEHNIPFNRVNDNHPDNIKLHNCNSRKIYADLYIDDRQLQGFPGWQITLDLIKDLENL